MSCKIGIECMYASKIMHACMYVHLSVRLCLCVCVCACVCVFKVYMCICMSVSEDGCRKVWHC